MASWTYGAGGGGASVYGAGDEDYD
jgi:hypothetical protein